MDPRARCCRRMGFAEMETPAQDQHQITATWADFRGCVAMVILTFKDLSRLMAWKAAFLCRQGQCTPTHCPCKLLKTQPGHQKAQTKPWSMAADDLHHDTCTAGVPEHSGHGRALTLQPSGPCAKLAGEVALCVMQLHVEKQEYTNIAFCFCRSFVHVRAPQQLPFAFTMLGAARRQVWSLLLLELEEQGCLRGHCHSAGRRQGHWLPPTYSKPQCSGEPQCPLSQRSHHEIDGQASSRLGTGHIARTHFSKLPVHFSATVSHDQRDFRLSFFMEKCLVVLIGCDRFCILKEITKNPESTVTKTTVILPLLFFSWLFQTT